MIFFLWNYLVLKYKNVDYSYDLKIRGRLFIHGKRNRIKIGNGVIICSSESINPTSGFNHTHLTAERKGKIEIGNDVGISNANIISHSEVIIDDNVMIGSGVKVWDTDFHSTSYENRMKHPDPDVKSAPIHIKEGAFIGACSIILKGVTIGERSVIGAGSVVTKDVPADEIWAGNPAHFVKKIN